MGYVARSHSYNEVPVLVTGDNFGRVRLFNYPSLQAGSPDKCYRGHCGHINRIVFSYNDKYCISIGGDDRCIFVWETDILDEIRERRAVAADILSKSSSSALKGTTASYADGHQFDEDEHNSFAPTRAYSQGLPQAGDESMAVKPWKGTCVCVCVCVCVCMCARYLLTPPSRTLSHSH